MTRLCNRIAAALSLAAIAAPLAAAPPPSGGTISIEPPAGDAGDDGRSPLAEGVAEALGGRGFTVLADRGHAAYVAGVSLIRADAGTGTAKVPSERATVAPGLFGAAGGGVSVPLGGAKTRSVALERVRLELTIRKRGSDAVLWRGVAVTVGAASGRGAEEALAARLGEAVLRSYPDEPRGIVSVP